MDGVSSVIALFSFSIQLVETIQKANKFLKEVQNAPEEVIKLVGTLDELEYLLIAVDGLIKRQNTMGDIPNSVEMIERALRRCRSTITTLETCVNTMKAYFDRHGRLYKAWASIRTLGKKDEVEQIRKQVEGDMSKLRTALNINMSCLQLHQIELVATRPSQDTSIQHANLATCTSVSNSAKPRDLVASRENSILRAKETDIWRYQTLFGEFRLRKKVMFLETSGYGPEKALSEESCLSFVSYLLHTAFELRSCEGFSKVPRSLSVFPVIQDSWIFYKWCFPENTEAFKQALSRRELSPYSRDEFGQTFLHRAIRSNNPELCSLLIQIGVDINHRDNDGRKALLGILAGRECKANIVRTLIKANCDIELEDLYYVFSDQYWGSPEAAELLFSACDVSSDTDLVDNWSFSFLTVALREFGVGISRWETWIRRLLHCKEDIHISRSSLQDGIPLGIQPWTHTALDDLFKNTDCPFDAERVAQDWLLMLAEAGFNVNEYLEKERYLHSAQDCLTSPHFFGNERQLVFEMDGKPSIGWEWWFHPLAPGSSVCHEFRNMNLAHHTNSFYIYNNDLWKDTWPYNYPEWSDCYKPGSPIFPLNAETQKLQEWQERKVKPWEKMRDNVACRHGRQTRKKYPQYFRELNKKPPVPGAWIEDSRK